MKKIKLTDLLCFIRPDDEICVQLENTVIDGVLDDSVYSGHAVGVPFLLISDYYVKSVYSVSGTLFILVGYKS